MKRAGTKEIFCRDVKHVIEESAFLVRSAYGGSSARQKTLPTTGGWANDAINRIGKWQRHSSELAPEQF